MTLGSFLTKVIGGVTLYYSGKDINRFGMAFKNKNPQSKIAQSFPDMYIRRQRIELSNTVLPTIVGDVQKEHFDFYLRDSWFPFLHGITGYCAGIFTGLWHNIVPIGLGIGALAFSKGGIIKYIKDKKTGKFVKVAFEKVKNPKPAKMISVKNPATGKFVKVPIESLTSSIKNKIKPKRVQLRKIPFLKRNGGKICAALLIFGALKSILTSVCGFGDYRKL